MLWGSVSRRRMKRKLINNGQEPNHRDGAIMALLFGFMWLTPKESTEAGADDDIARAIPQTAARVDSLSATEHEWLVKNIIEHGETVVLADSTHAQRLNDSAINLTVAGDSVTGTVTVDGKTLSWRDVCRADLKKMTVKEQRKLWRLLETLRCRWGDMASLQNSLPARLCGETGERRAQA